MSIGLECKKLKRTGFIPAFIGGGILAALVPVINMAVRAENYVGIKKPPLAILLEANWQMMAMFNVLLLVVGACIMYNNEYADNAMQKMNALPVKQSKLFFSKFVLLALTAVFVIFIEAGALTFCVFHWFSLSESFYIEIIKNTVLFVLLTMPAAMIMLLAASLCKNMWTSLGIGVICVFAATIIPNSNFILTLFPFSLPFQTIYDKETFRVLQYAGGAFIETILFGIVQVIFIKKRRDFQ